MHAAAKDTGILSKTSGHHGAMSILNATHIPEIYLVIYFV
jgi:hypothetical protein